MGGVAMREGILRVCHICGHDWLPEADWTCCPECGTARDEIERVEGQIAVAILDREVERATRGT